MVADVKHIGRVQALVVASVVEDCGVEEAWVWFGAFFKVRKRRADLVAWIRGVGVRHVERQEAIKGEGFEDREDSSNRYLWQGRAGAVGRCPTGCERVGEGGYDVGEQTVASCVPNRVTRRSERGLSGVHTALLRLFRGEKVHKVR